MDKSNTASTQGKLEVHELMIPAALNQCAQGIGRLKTPDQPPLTRITPSVCSPLSTTVPQSDGAPGAHILFIAYFPMSHFPAGIFCNHSQIKYLY